MQQPGEAAEWGAGPRVSMSRMDGQGRTAGHNQEDRRQQTDDQFSTQPLRQQVHGGFGIGRLGRKRQAVILEQCHLGPVLMAPYSLLRRGPHLRRQRHAGRQHPDVAGLPARDPRDA